MTVPAETVFSLCPDSASDVFFSLADGVWWGPVGASCMRLVDVRKIYET